MTGTEKLKLWIAGLLVIAVVYVLIYAEVSVAARFGMAVVGIGSAFALVFFSDAGRSFSVFIREAGVELRKIVWPTKQETVQLTGVVFIVVFLVTFFIWLIDLIIGFLLDKLVS